MSSIDLSAKHDSNTKLLTKRNHADSILLSDNSDDSDDDTAYLQGMFPHKKQSIATNLNEDPYSSAISPSISGLDSNNELINPSCKQALSRDCLTKITECVLNSADSIAPL